MYNVRTQGTLGRNPEQRWGLPERAGRLDQAQSVFGAITCSSRSMAGRSIYHGYSRSNAFPYHNWKRARHFLARLRCHACPLVGGGSDL